MRLFAPPMQTKSHTSILSTSPSNMRHSDDDGDDDDVGDGDDCGDD